MSGRARNQKGRGKGGQGGQGGQGNPAGQQTQEPAATPQARQQQQRPQQTPPANRPPQQQQQAVPPQNLDGAPDTRGRTQSPGQSGSRSGSKARAPSASGGDKKSKVAKGYDPETRKAYDLLRNVDLGGNAYTLKSGVSIHFSLFSIVQFQMRAWSFATAIVLLHSHTLSPFTSPIHPIVTRHMNVLAIVILAIVILL